MTSMRKIAAVCTALWLASGLSVATARAGDGRAGGLDEGLEDVMQSRFSKVAYGDGSGGVERSYDSEGNLTKAIYHDSPAAGMTETLVIDPKSGVWLRRFAKGRTVVREEREEYGPSERLLRRQSTWSSREDGKMDRRSDEAFAGVDVQKTAFELAAGQWRQTSRETMSAIVEASTPVGEYAECLKAAGKTGADPKAVEACRKGLDSILNLDATAYTAYANLECEDKTNQQLFLPEGFRIDTTSCGGDPWRVAQIKSAIHAMMGDMKCLSGLNPEVAKKFATKVAERRPRINCLGGALALKHETTMYKRLCGVLAGGAQDDACAQKVMSMRDPKTGAFFNSATPNDVYLVTADPAISIQRFRQNAEQDARTQLESGRLSYDDRDKYIEDAIKKQKEESLKYPSQSLGGVMLHEFLHLAGIPHNEHPVNCNGKQTIQHNCYMNGEYQKDAVYGCSAMCSNDSASRSHWTKEGCQACVKWNNKSPDLTKCDAKPSP